MKHRHTRLGILVCFFLISVSSHAAVTLYGYAQMEFGNQEVTGNLPGANRDESYVSDQNFGRIGIIATEKVAWGMTAIAKFEFRVNISTGALVMGGTEEKQGESFLGLKTRWGTFQFGAVKSPYKYWGGTSYDPFADTALEARNHGGMSGHTFSLDPAAIGPYLVFPANLPGNASFGHDGFMQNSASWKSFKWRGFEIWGSFSIDKADESVIILPPPASSGQPNTVIDTVVANGDYTFGLRYTNKGFEFGFGAFKNMMKRTVANPDLPHTTGRKVFTQYTKDKHTISLQWEKIEADRNTQPSMESEIYFVGYQYRWNEMSVFAAQYGASKIDEGTFLADQEVTYYALGFIYGLSKKTQLYAGYSKSEFTQGGTVATRELFGFGMRAVY